MNRGVLILIFGLMFFGLVSFDDNNLIKSITGNAVLHEDSSLGNINKLETKKVVRNVLESDDEILEEFAKGNEKVRVIVKLPESKGITIKNILGISQKTIIDESKIKRKLGDIVSVEMSLEELEELENVEILGIDRMMHVFLQDARGIIGAENVWELNASESIINGSRTAVCIIDTGVDNAHPDLSEKIIAQYCFCSADEGGSPNCCPDGTDEDNNATDNEGHGTHVAGIVAASGGIDGVARGANIVAVKVLNSSGIGSSLDIRAAIEWCSNDIQIDTYNISVISLSLGGGQYTTSASCLGDDGAGIQSAINGATAKNISVVISTGNTDVIYPDASAGIASPACLYNTTKVTASNKSDNYASYAFRHINFPDILVAPGSNINSTKNTGGYVPYSGTSMAAPMVAGTIALINQYLVLSGQAKTPSEIKTALNDTGLILDDSAESGYDFSRINVYDAILSLDVDVPNVTLVSPVNNKVDLTVNQTFVCNATDWQLANVTLKVWNSTGLYYNVTNNFIGISNETSFDLNNMPERSYDWNCLVADVEGNSDFASSNYSLTIGGISVNLVGPFDNNYTNINETNFTCELASEETYELSNVTFYLWNSSALVRNETKDVGGITNETTFTYNLTNEGNYSWNCLAVNNVSNESWAENNFSITYDVTSPNISSLSESVSNSGATITWVTNELTNSSISGDVSGSSTDYVTSHSVSISGLSASTTYSYVATSCDRAGNCNNSSNSFTTSAAPPSGGGSSGGSSFSSAVFVPKTYEVNVTEITEGYTQSLKKDEKVDFSIFDSEGGQHLLTINEVDFDFVELTIESNPINLKLGIGQSAKLNLTSDSYYDLFVKLNNITNGFAELTIQLINEPIEPKVVEVIKEEIIETEVVTTEYYFKTVAGLIIALVISIGIIILLVIKVTKKIKSRRALKKKDNKYGKKNKETKA